MSNVEVSFRRLLLGLLSFFIAVIPTFFLHAAQGKQYAFFNGADPAIYYFGRVKREANAVWTWPGSGLRVVYNNSTSVTVRLHNDYFWDESSQNTPRMVWYRVDQGGWNRFYLGANSENDVQLFVPGSKSKHQLDIVKASEGQITFKALLLDEGATIEPPPVPGTRIEVVGDSTSTGYKIYGSASFENAQNHDARNSYGWLLANRLGAEVHIVAITGRGLVHNFGMPAGNPVRTVPGDYPFWERDYDEPNNWGWQPNVVIVNLGTNDVSGPAETPPADFQGAYVGLLTMIRDKNPGALILAMTPFGLKSGAQRVYPKEIEAAVALRKSAGDNRVAFVDTSGWLGRSDFTDGVHPNINGHVKAAGRLASVIRGLGSAAVVPVSAPAASPTPGTVAAVTCPGAKSTRLAVGQNARVIADGLGPSPVRDQPGGGVIYNAPEGTVLKIFDGPRCYRRGWFWLVYLPDGRAGWVLEGDRQRYFIEPA
jgi:lysophospholipase L1-like esterase